MSRTTSFANVAAVDPGAAVLPVSSWEICHPSPSLQHGLSHDLSQRSPGASRAVIVDSQGETLLVAVSEPADRGLAARLASIARRPVQLQAAGPDEIDLALALCEGRPDAPERKRRRLVTLADDLGLSYLLAPGANQDDPLTHLSGEWGPELRGLLEGLPHLAVSADDLPAPLRLLLPPDMRDTEEGRLITPWGLEGDTLILACAAFPRPDTLDAIRAWTGFPLRCVLADETVIRAAAQCQEETGTSPGPSRLFKRRKPAGPGKSDDVQERRLQAIALQTGESLESLQQRYMPARADAKQPETPVPGPEVHGLLPLALLLSLTCIPLAMDRDVLDLAVDVDSPDQKDLAAAVSILTGREIRLRRYPSASVRRALLQKSVSGAQALPTSSRGDGILTARLQTAADEVAQGQALAALHRLPFIRLEHYAVVSEAVACVPLDRLRELDAVPLRREAQVLWVVLAEPDENALRDLAQISGLSIRPLLATRSAIRERLTSLNEMHRGHRLLREAEERFDNPVLTMLQADGLVTKADLLRLLQGSDEPLDQALDQAGVLSFHQFCEASSRLTGYPAIDLRLRRHDEEIIDGLGQRTVRPVWNDPVEPEVSRGIPTETMRSLAILPVHRQGDHVLVAVADPFDPQLQPVLDDVAAGTEGALPRLVLAPRPAILTAIARVCGHVPLGDLLLTHGMVTPRELAGALQLHRTAGVRLGQALLNLGLIEQDQLAYLLAEQQELPFFRLSGIQPDEQVARLLPEEVERTLGAVPLYYVDDTLVVATPDPQNQKALDEVAARTGRTVSPVVCTEDDFESILETLYREEYLHFSTSELVARTPEESASSVLSKGQQIAFLLFGVAVLGLLMRAPATLGTAVTGACSFFYLAFSIYRSYLIYHSLSHDLEIPVSDKEVAALKDVDLPVYTILVPLYKEASVLPTLLLGLTRLNYPSTKLDVKLLLEEDDTETREAVDAMQLPSYVRSVVVPAAEPRCKPKACNYGLLHARGAYVVIYDAEDVPDPDQLKKVVVAFRKGGEDMACLQAKLNYYNSRQNLLTAWFTNEYSMWFDLFLPGLDAANVPIPLGGTSNHFPTARLREIGAWDPYNVTEDADLGVRLYRRGWKTGVVDSTTLEEANSEVYNWIRQRSRWVKGYIQTYLVHMRNPFRLWRRLGTKAFLSFNMVVGGTFIAFLLNPVFWCLTATWYLSHAGFIRAIFPAPVFYMGMVSLAAGNFAFIYLNVAACLRRGHYGMVKHALISPLYWALMSIAAWKGFIQLWTNPFYWEKTTHGLYQKAGSRHSPEVTGDPT